VFSVAFLMAGIAAYYIWIKSRVHM